MSCVKKRDYFRSYAADFDNISPSKTSKREFLHLLFPNKNKNNRNNFNKNPSQTNKPT